MLQMYPLEKEKMGTVGKYQNERTDNKKRGFAGCLLQKWNKNVFTVRLNGNTQHKKNIMLPLGKKVPQWKHWDKKVCEECIHKDDWQLILSYLLWLVVSDEAAYFFRWWGQREEAEEWNFTRLSVSYQTATA